jgi:hypothetical protein
MTEQPKTLGQVAYEARFQHQPQAYWDPWENLDPVAKHVWDRVASAVAVTLMARATVSVRDYLESIPRDLSLVSIVSMPPGQPEVWPTEPAHVNSPETLAKLVEACAGQELRGGDGAPVIPTQVVYVRGFEADHVHTHNDLENMKRAGLIRDWKEEEDGTMLVQFNEPLASIQFTPEARVYMDRTTGDLVAQAEGAAMPPNPYGADEGNQAKLLVRLLLIWMRDQVGYLVEDLPTDGRTSGGAPTVTFSPDQVAYLQHIQAEWLKDEAAASKFWTRP